MKRDSTTARLQKKKQKPLSQKQILMIGLGGGVAVGLGYLAYSHFRNKAAVRRSTHQDSGTVPPATSVTPPNLPVTTSSFPLKRGASGSLVAMLQNALIAKGGQPALILRETSFRNGQVDGIFGKGTQRALHAAGFPSAITQSNFTTIIGKRASSGFDAGGIAKTIIGAARKRNLFGVLSGLENIHTVAQYQEVSTFFQGVRILGIRVTSLVNALLSVAFRQKELEKVKIRAEFRRMGLKQNARGVWFIPGLGEVTDLFENNQEHIHQEWNLAIAVKPTLLKSADGSFIVPELAPHTVVGYITGMEHDMTRILTQSGETVFAPTRNLSSF